MSPWLSQTTSGVEIAIYAAPRASRTRVVGPHGDRLKVQVTAPPVDGAANREIEKLLAGALGVSRSAVSVIAGETSKRKRVRIDGVDSASAREALDA